MNMTLIKVGRSANDIEGIVAKKMKNVCGDIRRQGIEKVNWKRKSKFSCVQKCQWSDDEC